MRIRPGEAMLFHMIMTIAFVTLAWFTTAFAAQESCPAGEGRLSDGDPCIPSSLRNYLYCLQKSGQGKIEVTKKDDVSKTGTLEVKVDGKGSGVVIKGEGAANVKTSEASRAIQELNEKLDPSLTKNCKDITVAPPPKPPPKPPSLTLKLVEFDLHATDFLASSFIAEPRTFANLSGVLPDNKVREVGEWVIGEIKRTYHLTDSPPTFPIKVSVPPGSRTINLNPDPSSGGYKIYSWVIDKRNMQKIHEPIFNSDLSAAFAQAEINGDKSAYLHLDKPGYQLELIEIPLKEGFEGSVVLTNLSSITVLVEKFGSENNASEQLRSYLNRNGIKTVGPEKYNDIERVRSRTLNNPSALLNELRADRFDLIIKGSFNPPSVPGKP